MSSFRESPVYLAHARAISARNRRDAFPYGQVPQDILQEVREADRALDRARTLQRKSDRAAKRTRVA